MIGGTVKAVLTTGSLAVTLASTRDVANNFAQLPGIRYKFIESHLPSASDEVTENYQTVRAHHGPGTNPRSAVSVLAEHQRQLGSVGSYENITSANAYGTQYAIDVTFHETTLSFILDTGSSDTWAVKDGFRCFDYAGEEVGRDACGFGPTYPGGLQYGDIPGEHIYIRYSDGETVFGETGYSDVTVSNITVKKQQVGLVNSTFWYGNNMTSGVIGLAFPTLTSAYQGNGSDHSWMHQVSYSPLFTTMVKDGLVRPYFSIAINRNSSDGVIGWGGIPPVTGLEHSTTVAVDIVLVSHRGKCPVSLS